MTLAQRVAAPAAAQRRGARSIVGVQPFRARGAPRDAARIAPGHLGSSVLALRMRSRDPLQQMPPLGTAIDAEALALLARWIESLTHTNQVELVRGDRREFPEDVC